MYDIDINNFTEDDFDSFDDFANDAAVIAQTLAPERRANGMQVLQDINAFMSKARRTEEVSGTPLPQILVNMLRQDPRLCDRVCLYLEGEGYEPADNFDDIAAQAAYARTTQIKELQDEYSSDNFDDVDNLFGKKNKAARQQRKAQRSAAKTKRQATRQEKKQAKQETKLKRKLRRGELVDAKFNRKIAQEQREQNDIETAPEMEMPELDSPSANTAFQQSTEFGDIMELANPSPEMAHAEIIGEEMEEGFFEGDVDTFLPFLAGALEVGGQLVSGAKKQGGDFTNLKTLFGRKKATTGAKTQLGAKLPNALNAGIKEVMETVKAREKQNFLKENMIWIILAVVVIFLAGRMIK
jgi:hypothetical protein